MQFQYKNIIDFQKIKLDYLYDKINKTKDVKKKMVLQGEVFRYKSFLLRNNYINSQNITHHIVKQEKRLSYF